MFQMFRAAKYFFYPDIFLLSQYSQIILCQPVIKISTRLYWVLDNFSIIGFGNFCHVTKIFMSLKFAQPHSVLIVDINKHV